MSGSTAGSCHWRPTPGGPLMFLPSSAAVSAARGGPNRPRGSSATAPATGPVPRIPFAPPNPIKARRSDSRGRSRMDGTDAARTLGLVAPQIADSHFRPTRRRVLSERSKIRSEEHEILSEPSLALPVRASSRPDDRWAPLMRGWSSNQRSSIHSDGLQESVLLHGEAKVDLSTSSFLAENRRTKADPLRTVPDRHLLLATCPRSMSLRAL